MTITSTSYMFYLGKLAQLDTYEGNTTNENPDAILGTYSKPPIVRITNHDMDDDGAIMDDEQNLALDYISFDLGGGTRSYTVDSSSSYNATVLLGDKTSISFKLGVIQTTTGETFAFDLTGADELEGQNIQSIQLVSAVNSDFAGHWTSHTVNGASVVCFVSGTRLLTSTGWVAVQDISEGDQIMTQDHGLQPCLAITRTNLLRPGRNAPIRIEAGALAPGVPGHPLKLSPQHRVLVRSPLARQFFGAAEVLVAVHNLLSLPGVRKSLGVLPVTYHHFALQRHEIIFANGAATESLLTGPEARRSLPDRPEFQRVMAPARIVAQGIRVRKMLERHLRNRTPRGVPLAPVPDLPDGYASLTMV